MRSTYAILIGLCLASIGRAESLDWFWLEPPLFSINGAMALTADDQPRILYEAQKEDDDFFHELRYAWLVDGHWQFTSLGDSFGRIKALEILPNGLAHASIRDGSYSNPQWVDLWQTESGWQTEDVDGPSIDRLTFTAIDSHGWTCQIEWDLLGSGHIASYYRLRYVVEDTSVVIRDRVSMQRPDTIRLALDSQDRPHVLYIDSYSSWAPGPETHLVYGCGPAVPEPAGRVMLVAIGVVLVVMLFRRRRHG